MRDPTRQPDGHVRSVQARRDGSQPRVRARTRRPARVPEGRRDPEEREVRLSARRRARRLRARVRRGAPAGAHAREALRRSDRRAEVREVTRIVVDNRIRIRLGGLSRDRVDGLTGAFRHANPTRKPGSDDPEFFESWSQEGDELTIPRGGLARVLELEPGFQIDDQTVWSHPEPSIPNHLVAWRPYQRLMIAAAVRARTCLLRAPTGSGKTTGGFGLISVLKHRSLVMVWTGNLEKQWRERCASELGIDEARVGRIRGSRDDHAPVTVAMQQTVVSRLRRGARELSHAYDLLLCDEVQRFAAPTLFASVDPFAARYRVGISADEARRGGEEVLAGDPFG